MQSSLKLLKSLLMLNEAFRISEFLNKLLEIFAHLPRRYLINLLSMTSNHKIRLCKSIDPVVSLDDLEFPEINNQSNFSLW